LQTPGEFRRSFSTLDARDGTALMLLPFVFRDDECRPYTEFLSATSSELLPDENVEH
jgi:hypothetical protein